MNAALAQGELGEAFVMFGHARQDLGGRRQRGVVDLGLFAIEGLGVRFASMGLVEQLGQRANTGDQFAGPLLEADRLTIAVQLQARATTLLDHGQEVVGALAALVVAQLWAFLQRAEQQEGVEEARLGQVDTYRQERVDVQATHFDILHATGRQRLDRTFTGVGDAFGADVRVVLVLDLQDVGVELHPLAIDMGADLDVRRVRRAHRPAQAIGIAGQVVVARREAGLGIALVAQVAHAQAGGIGQEQGLGIELFELVRVAPQEAFVQGRGGAEQVHQQPAVAAEVADQGDVGRGLEIAIAFVTAFGGAQQRPQRFGQREIVMDAGDALHGAAVAQGQALTVHVLELADVRGAVLGDRDVLLSRQYAGHRRAPQVFVTQLAIDEAVGLLEAFEYLGGVGQGRGDELQQRLGIVGGDQLVGQRRAQCLWMRGLGQATFVGHAQAFALNTVQALLEQGKIGAEQAQAAVEEVAQDVFLHASVAPIWG